MSLPPLALSVRQPWAWAILHAGKDVENRSPGSVRAGGMTTGPVALHAAKGMTRDEYDHAVWRMGRDGIAVPRPEALPRGAVVGRMVVTGFVTESDSPWYGGAVGLTFAQVEAVAPIPAPGARGYFAWRAEGTLAPPRPWMTGWDGGGGGLFDDAPAWESPPPRPWGRRR